jgi:hypothetical protein
MFLMVIVHVIGQVPVGVLPAGQPAAMHAFKYPESAERTTGHSG